MLVPLILGTFRDSQVLDVAMSSRAFGAPAKRTFLLESHFEAMDYVMLAFAAILLCGWDRFTGHEFWHRLITGRPVNLFIDCFTLL